MKKWQIENSEKSEISDISEKLFRVFFFPSFQFYPTAKIENSDLIISEISGISEVSKFSTWPDNTPLYCNRSTSVLKH